MDGGRLETQNIALCPRVGHGLGPSMGWVGSEFFLIFGGLGWVGWRLDGVIFLTS